MLGLKGLPITMMKGDWNTGSYQALVILQHPLKAKNMTEWKK